MKQGTEEHHVSFLWEQKGTHLYIWLDMVCHSTGNREQWNIMCGEKGNIWLGNREQGNIM
jgi:hypothetical protein